MLLPIRVVYAGHQTHCCRAIRAWLSRVIWASAPGLEIPDVLTASDDLTASGAFADRLTVKYSLVRGPQNPIAVRGSSRQRDISASDGLTASVAAIPSDSSTASGTIGDRLTVKCSLVRGPLKHPISRSQELAATGDISASDGLTASVAATPSDTGRPERRTVCQLHQLDNGHYQVLQQHP